MKLTLILSLIFVNYLSSPVKAETSANIGLVSQYHFRGVQQTAGPSTSVGIDHESNGFSLGSWVADVDDGLEIDIYGGYEYAWSDNFSLFIGATSYQYTGDFDSAYNELNVSGNYGIFSIGYHLGRWDGEVGNEAATESDYNVTTLGFSQGDFSGELGIYGGGSEGEYLDIAYNTSIGNFDISIGLLVSGSDLDDDESLYFSFRKNFVVN